MFFIYRNLHKKKFSIKDIKKRKVVDWKDCFIAVECHFKISESGRLKVIKEKRKNVHAGIVCDTIIGNLDQEYIPKLTNPKLIPLYYNPYKQDCFTRVDTNQKVEFARYVLCQDNKIYLME